MQDVSGLKSSIELKRMDAGDTEDVGDTVLFKRASQSVGRGNAHAFTAIVTMEWDP